MSAMGVPAHGASRIASCSCGGLTARTRREPLRVSLCHCLDCQRRSGSAFAVQARFAAADVVVAGESKEYVRVGDAGGTARFRFCTDCGATVFYPVDASPDELAIPLGAFADPRFTAPTTSIYRMRLHAWLELSGSIEQYD